MSRDDPLERRCAWAWLEFRRQQTRQTWQSMPTSATSIATPWRRTGQRSLRADQPATTGAAGQPLPAAPGPPFAGKVRSAVGNGAFFVAAQGTPTAAGTLPAAVVKPLR